MVSSEVDRMLPVSAVAQILYCPRNFYYRVLEGVNDVNHHVLEGKLQEEIRETRLKRDRGTRYQIRRISLSSDYYGITGILDTIEEGDGSYYPIEYKKGRLRHNLNDDVQLCLQTFLLEEYLDTNISIGYIYYVESAKRRQVIITDDLRDIALEAIRQARAIISDGSIPEPVNDHRCKECSLQSRCLPEESAYLTGKGDKPRKVISSANLGRVLYIDVQGSYVRKKEGCISVIKDKEIIQEVPLNSIDQVVMVGQVNTTVPLLDELLKRGIPAYFCSNNGGLSGWLHPTWNKNSLLRIAQYRAFDEGERKLEFAKAFVYGKIANCRTMLMRYNRTRKNDHISTSVASMARFIKKITVQKSLNELMGIEGMATRVYFDCFSYIIRQEGFTFVNRNRRPPQDPVNAMLSFGYAMLTKDIINEITKIGLDPYLGFLHSPIYGRPALALDLIEEFRPIIVDSAVINAINTHMVSPEDFVMNGNSCILKESGRKAFFQAYRNRINEEITHPVFGYKLSYRRTIELQARIFAKVLQGEYKKYIPFIVR